MNGETGQSEQLGVRKWVTIPERSGYCLVSVDNRSVLVLVPVTETGELSLKIAGYFLEDWRLLGERGERMTFLVEEIPEKIREIVRTKTQAGLPAELRSLQISYWTNPIAYHVDVASPLEQRTEVLKGLEDVLDATINFLASARERMDVCSTASRPNPFARTSTLKEAYFAIGRRGGHLRLLTEITPQNLQYCKGLMKYVEIRHLDNIKDNFAVSETEYLATPGTDDFTPVGPVLYSNQKAFVEHHQSMFDLIWEKAIPADLRVKQIEEGEGVGETKLSFNLREILDATNGFIMSARQEVLLIVPNEENIRTNLNFYQALLSNAKVHNIKMKMLGQFSDGTNVTGLMRELGLEDIEVRKIGTAEKINLGLGIYDRKGMVLAQYMFPEPQGPEDTYISAVISTNPQTVQGIAVIFESLWRESELRDKEEHSRRTSELMQDILTHDIRNFNQIARLNAELLDSKLSDGASKELVGSILGAIDGATNLLNKARSLGKILWQENVVLSPVNLSASINRSIALIRKSNPEKDLTVKFTESPSASVTADDLIDQVFVNVLSNAVKYTDSLNVQVEISIDHVNNGAANESKTGQNPMWRVTIADHGRGIPDSRKPEISRRYLQTAKGSGLGLSIVRALVEQRYHGRIELEDTVPQDHTKGTTVKIWLPQSIS